MQTSIEQHAITNIVIVGGGAGGLKLTTAPENKLGSKGKTKITLVDKHRGHIWKPLLLKTNTT
ncbi:MAG: NADH dehydrogenase [Arenicella sp.]|jgi:NADH dehydrogenase